MVQVVVAKLPPKVLEQILHTEQAKFHDPHLLVGNETKDDAAVYDLGNGIGIISTTDFFMPIVDSPYEFGRIAATNAISDVFAMGGKTHYGNCYFRVAYCETISRSGKRSH
ncbi:Selenide, water dikinase [Providencia stuartii]|nr:Selenide, water dikinase [Providencia stuartii]